MDVNIIIQALQGLLIVCVLCEALTESAKLIWPKPLADNQKQALAFAFGIVLCVCMGLSLFEGALIIKLIGAVFAGILAGRGSNYLHALISIFMGLASVAKVKAQVMTKELTK